MKIREGFILREISGATVAVPTGQLVSEFNAIINLNDPGKFMWELLENNTTIEEVENKVLEKYNVSEEKAIEVTEKFINNLENANIIQA